MTNNDELWMKLEAAESDELALNGNEVSNQLRHLADNEIDSDSFAVVTENYNGSEVEFERPITDLALDAAGLIDALLAERDADKKRIAELYAGHTEAAKRITSWRRLAKQNIAEHEKAVISLDAARQRIAELEARTVSLTIKPPTIGRAYSALAHVWTVQEVREACAAAGIKLEVGE